MSGSGFVHLHNHTDFSMLDGAARVDDLLGRTAELGMPALAVTDHGNMFGAYEFYKTAKKHGVQPIIGLEAYLTPGTPRGERKRVQFGDGTGDDVAAKGAYTHMTMWASSTEGMHNLFRLSSKSSLEGFFYKPRADRELLQRYHNGLIATTGCPSGEVQTYLRLGQYDKAVASAAEFQEIFGRENFYVELMDHGLDIETRVRRDLLRLAQQIGAPLVATNDLHYVRAEDAAAQDILLCVSAGARRSDPNRFKFDGSGYYLRTPEEMRQLFSNLPQACDSTLAIAERCQVEFTEGMATYMPSYPVPADETEQSWFVKQVWQGLERRYPVGMSDEVRARAEYEIDVISQMGFPGYFLVVADYINWAKDHGVRVGPGRGSGAGSICAYALRITDLDPLKHGLLFERFLNPERINMPDFDVDFDDRRRADVIGYVTQRYGADKVSQIVTYGTIKAKQAIKDAARVLDKPFNLGDRINKTIPDPQQGHDVSLAQLFDENSERYAEGAEFRELYQSDPEVHEVVDTARGIEGLKRQWGVHAAGVIMSSVPLEDVIPIMKREQDGAIITQFDYPSCEALGLIKMDFLGLRNLTVLGDAVDNIRANRDITIDLESLPLDDPDTYKLVASGETLGIFQFDSAGYQQLCRLMRPDKFSDFTALGALFRPGPMGTNTHINYALRKNGQQPVDYIHPELTAALEPILGETYGLLVYQEQVMEIARQLAGYSLGGADLLRRAMGKKKKSVMDAEEANFRAGMLQRGYSEDAFRTLWETLVPFSAYGFNKSHAAAYGLVSYWTAYLKAHFPAEYMAALLQSVRDDKDRSAVYLNECRRMGINVLPPDVNESQGKFTPVGTDIRFGLGAIRNVGENVVNGIVQGREDHGKAHDFYEFLDHSPLVVCNKRVVESLIKAGAFDSMGHTRRALMEVFETAVDQIVDVKRNEEHGQDSLASFFGLDEDPLPDGSGQSLRGEVPDLPEWDKRTRLAFERDMLGLYVSDHPLRGLEHVLAAERTITIGRLLAEGPEQDGQQQTIAGMITHVTRKQNRRGELWALIGVEDLEAGLEVMVFPKVYERVAMLLAPDTVVRIRGRVRAREESIDFSATEVSVPDLTSAPSGPLVIQLPANRCTPEVVDRLRGVLSAHPGATEVRMRLLSPARTSTFRLGEGLRVTNSNDLMADLKVLLGPNCLAN